MGTTFRIITSPITTPIKWVFKKDVPSDGIEACRAAWFGEAAPAGEAQQ